MQNNDDGSTFALKIDFEKDSERPARIFRTMSEMIDALYAIDLDLVKSLDIEIEPEIILEDIQVGSIKTIFRTIIKAVPDSAIEDLSGLPTVL